jgi:hypothetical protein
MREQTIDYILVNPTRIRSDIECHLNPAATVDTPNGDTETGAASIEEIKT